MFNLNDIENIEYDNGCDELEYYASIQRAINDGLWSLQGSYGRTMMGAIESGSCLLGKGGFRDYWGNYIPSRDQVKTGTKGSYEFVADRMGDEYAEMMAAV